MSSEAFIKLVADRLDVLDGSFCIKLDVQGQWYATLNAEIKDGGILRGVAHHSVTILGAVTGLWEELTNLKKGETIVINAYDKKRRREYVWNSNAKLWREVTCYVDA